MAYPYPTYKLIVAISTTIPGHNRHKNPRYCKDTDGNEALIVEEEADHTETEHEESEHNHSHEESEEERKTNCHFHAGVE